MARMLIGIVAKPQGLKGEIKVNPLTDDINRFKKLTYVYLNNKKFDIENVSVRGGFVVLKLQGVNSCEQAELYRQFNVEVEREDAVDLQENEYFMVDLIGCKIMLEDGTLIGEVKYFDQFGASFVATATDAITNKNFMFPFIEDILVKVDTENKVIVVNGEKFEEVKV